MIKLTPAEEEVIYSLAESLTGSSQKGRWRKSVLVQNVIRRMQQVKITRLAKYLELVSRDEREYKNLLSALTIHFTSFFRESEQFEPLIANLMESREGQGPVRVLVAACSSGEEVYSLALFLEDKRVKGEIPDYEITGFDLDPVSVSYGKKAIYPAERLKDIPVTYRRFLRLGSGHTEGLFTFEKDVRSRVKFFESDLRNIHTFLKSRNEALFDAISCRNVLIYFDEKGVKSVVDHLTELILPSGILALGHSESIDGTPHGLTARGRSIYRKKASHSEAQTLRSKVGKALVVDDSSTIRKIMGVILSRAGFDVECVESAREASSYLQENAVDIISLDLHMPELDGATWLRQQRSSGMRTPVVIISDAAPQEAEGVLGALTGGAQDYLSKKELASTPELVGEKLREIALQHSQREKLGTGSRAVRKDEHFKRFPPELIVIASSTGGTEALVSMMGLMPAKTPPILVVQHITSSFAKAFAMRLARASGLALGDMKADTVLQPSTLYMALDDYHIGVKRVGSQLRLDISHAPQEHSVRPAADYLFRTTAKTRSKVIGVVLTGMGKDGALGLLDLKQQGAYTLAQDEASCVVFGMPREAIQVGAVRFVGDLRSIRAEMDYCLNIAQQNVA